jgi:hypothetical protein
MFRMLIERVSEHTKPETQLEDHFAGGESKFHHVRIAYSHMACLYGRTHISSFYNLFYEKMYDLKDIITK